MAICSRSKLRPAHCIFELSMVDPNLDPMTMSLQLVAVVVVLLPMVVLAAMAAGVRIGNEQKSPSRSPVGATISRSHNFYRF